MSNDRHVATQQRPPCHQWGFSCGLLGAIAQAKWSWEFRAAAVNYSIRDANAIGPSSNRWNA